MITKVDNSPKEPTKIHPQQFALWLSIGSMIMMFGGFTSGFIVRKSQGNWLDYKMPIAFWISTLIVILSSVTIHLAVKSFKERRMAFHKNMVIATLILGISFVLLQYVGFQELFSALWQKMGVDPWPNNVSLQFLVVIASVHALHIIGGLIILAILFFVTFRRSKKVYSPKGIQMMATYWHFVGILWIYLFVFFMMNQ